MNATEEHIIKECWECDKCLALGDHLVHCSGEWEHKTERGILESDMLDRINKLGKLAHV